MQERDTAQDVLSLGTSHFREANERIRDQLERVDRLTLEEVFAQRYLGCALPQGKHLAIHGTPGNDMAAYLDGGTIEVFGSAQDQIGNTMNDGEVIIHGRCGDAAGYAMRGGCIFIRDDCGWRAGINMKEYQDKQPIIVIGGDAGSFLGEYMAGGTILLLGNPGDHLATGMHGGVIYLREPPSTHALSSGITIAPLAEEDRVRIEQLLGRYRACFAGEVRANIPADAEEFLKLVPASSRPYASLYAN